MKRHQQQLENDLCGWDKTWDDLGKCLPEKDCRIAVYAVDQDPKPVLVEICWSPDKSNVRAKMIYCSCRSDLKQQLQGFDIEFGATDLNELDYDYILHKIKILKR